MFLTGWLSFIRWNWKPLKRAFRDLKGKFQWWKEPIYEFGTKKKKNTLFPFLSDSVPLFPLDIRDIISVSVVWERQREKNRIFDDLFSINIYLSINRNGQREGCACVFSRVWLFATPWTATHQAPLSMRFPRQEYWSGLSFSSPGTLPNPGIKPTSQVSPALAGRFFTTEPPGEPQEGIS